MTTREAADKWGLQIKTVQRVAKAGRIKGAKQAGKAWIIPDDAECPLLTVGRPRLYEPAEKECPKTEQKEAAKPLPSASLKEFTQKAENLLNALYSAYKAYNPQGVYLAVAINGGTIRVNNSYWSYDWQRPIDMRWEGDSNGNAGEGQGDSSGVHGTGTED